MHSSLISCHFTISSSGFFQSAALFTILAEAVNVVMQCAFAKEGAEMPKLTFASRKKLPDNAFAGHNRSYPVPDEAHAKAAKSRASQAVHAKRMNKSEEDMIDVKANKVLGKKRT